MPAMVGHAAMSTFVMNLPRALCLLVLLSTTGCDQLLSSLPGPAGLRGATPTMHGDEGDDGDKGDDGGEVDEGGTPELGLPKIICCGCGRVCTEPDEPDPMVGG